MHMDVENRTYWRTGAGRPAECAEHPGETYKGGLEAFWEGSCRGKFNMPFAHQRWLADLIASRIPLGPGSLLICIIVLVATSSVVSVTWMPIGPYPQSFVASLSRGAGPVRIPITPGR